MQTYQKVIIAVVICALALSAVQWMKKGQESSLLPVKEPTIIEVAKARSGAILRRVRTVGELTAIQSVEIHPEIDGKVAQVCFTEGQNVNVGDPLFKLDDKMAKAKVKEAQARMVQARLEHGRAVKLLEKKFGTEQMRDKTLADMHVAEASLDEVKILLDRTTIRAPFEGVVGLSEVSVGAFVSPSSKLTIVVDLDPINVDFRLPESYLPFVHVGDAVDVTIEDFDILPVDAEIVAISPQVDELTRTIVVRARMLNKAHDYRPGEFANIMVVAGEIKNAVLVPQIAIEREGEEEFVWVVVDNVAIKTTVSTGVRDANDVEITHGVKENDLIITAGQFKVHDGEEVIIANPPEQTKK